MRQTADRYEHTADLIEAQDALRTLRKKIKRLLFISGGVGYEGMGARELDQLRNKVDETEFWLSAATRALNAGGERAVKQGYWKKTPRKQRPSRGPQ